MPQQLVEKTEQQNQQKEILREETRRKESFSGAEIGTITDDRIDVTLTKQVMTAEATLIRQGDDEQKVMNFDEDEVDQTHTLTLEDSIYERFKASPWAVLEDMIKETETTPVHTWEPSPWSRLQHLNLSLTDITLQEQTPMTAPPVPVQEPGIDTDQSTLPEPVDYNTLPDRTLGIYYETDPLNATEPYEQFTAITPVGLDDHTAYLEYGHDTNIDILLLDQDTDSDYDTVLASAGRALTVLEHDTRSDIPYDPLQDTASLERELSETDYDDQRVHSDESSLAYRRYDPDETEHGITEEISYTVTADDAENAAEVLESLFEETALSGNVETMTYQDTEDGYVTKESYWAEIDGLDMYRTEFFVNGELAEDSLDAYDLDAGDTLTFVEANMFDDSDDASNDDTSDGGACSGDLYLDDLLADAENATVMSTDYDTSLGLDGEYSSSTAVPPRPVEPLETMGYGDGAGPQYA